MTFYSYIEEARFHLFSINILSWGSVTFIMMNDLIHDDICACSLFDDGFVNLITRSRLSLAFMTESLSNVLSDS